MLPSKWKDTHSQRCTESERETDNALSSWGGAWQESSVGVLIEGGKRKGRRRWETGGEEDVMHLWSRISRLQPEGALQPPAGCHCSLESLRFVLFSFRHQNFDFEFVRHWLLMTHIQRITFKSEASNQIWAKYSWRCIMLPLIINVTHLLCFEWTQQAQKNKLFVNKYHSNATTMHFYFSAAMAFLWFAYSHSYCWQP